MERNRDSGLTHRQELEVSLAEDTRDDIRRLLKEFGVRADGAIVTHLAQAPGTQALHLRCTLVDLTDYGDGAPPRPLQLEVEGTIRR
jgi:hypothetical protein